MAEQTGPDARPFRFGLQASEWPAAGGGSVRAQLQELARRAESVGFDVLTVADHVMPILPPMALVQICAEITTSLRFGSFVLNNDFRHPVLVASEAAAASLLCDGRFELGIGAGHNKAEYDALGISFAPARVRVARLCESVAVLRQLLDGDTVSYVGDHYQLDHVATGVPTAPQRVAILVGGNGRSVLDCAGRLADTVGLTAITPTAAMGHVHQPRWSDEYLKTRIDIVEAAAAGRTVKPERNALVQHAVRTGDRRAAAQAFCDEVRPLGIELDVEDALTTPFLFVGTAQQIADQIRETREHWGITYFTTRTSSFDLMADVIAILR